MVAVGCFFLASPGKAQVYNLHLVTDNQPDYTDLESFVASSTGNWKTPEEKAIAVWRWGRRSRHQLSCSREGAKYIMDPILNYNSYGALNCGIISGLNTCSWLKLGFQARYVQLGDDTVSEVSWDDHRLYRHELVRLRGLGLPGLFHRTAGALHIRRGVLCQPGCLNPPAPNVFSRSGGCHELENRESHRRSQSGRPECQRRPRVGVGSRHRGVLW